MLHEKLLHYSIRDQEVVPCFLGAEDAPWLRQLLDESLRFVGRPRRMLDERLREPPPKGTPPRKRLLAIEVLRRLLQAKSEARIPPKRARAAVFGQSAAGLARAETLHLVANALGMKTDDVEESLFADLPGERRVIAPDPVPSPQDLAARANLALAQGLLYRATSLVLEAEGNARTIVRHAKLRGLICTVSARERASDAALHISGPLALFRRTVLYGRALGEILPLCAWCERFRLRAKCVLRDQSRRLELTSGDPIFPSSEPRRFDSKLEERFARDFARLAPAWGIVREPEPVATRGSLVFPDFALQHRRDPLRRWLLEIVGFWTPDYVARKLAQYREAGLGNLILCIDGERACSDDELPLGARVIRFRRRIDPQAVLSILGESDLSGGGAS